MEVETSSENRIAIAWVVLALVAAPILWHFSPYNGPSAPAKRTKAINHVKQLLLGCRAYAADHEGAYPSSLETLYPDYIDLKDFFHVPDDSGILIPMIYHTGHKDLDEPHAILIEHPLLFDRRRIVGYVGGHVQEVVVK
jgi:hypothetical protein